MGDDGKNIFMRENCTKCHSIKAEGVEPQKESLLKGKKIIDHSGVGIRRDSEWIQKWLKKEIENEKGRKHKVKWKGNNEDLKILAEFLSNLRREIPEDELKKWYQDLLNSSR
jgi:mono/diheme cytochrome c family protein